MLLDIEYHFYWTSATCYMYSNLVVRFSKALYFTNVLLMENREDKFKLVKIFVVFESILMK